MKTLVVGVSLMLAGMGLAQEAAAGGRGGGHFIVRPAMGFHGGFRSGGGFGRGVGFARRAWAGGAGVGRGIGAFGGYGHTGTAFRGGRSFGGGGGSWGWNRLGSGGYGHVNTAYRPAFSRLRTFGSGYGAGRGVGYGGGSFRYGWNGGRPGFRRYPWAVYGSRGFGYGGYGGYGGFGYANVSAAPDYGTGGSVEPSLAQRYAEPPVGYGHTSTEGGSTGGPEIISVGPNQVAPDSCDCTPATPVVYRFGVGSYY